MSSPLPIMPDPKNENTPPPQSRLSWFARLIYGVGGLTSLFGNYTVKALAVPFYQMTLHVDPALLGVAMAIPRFWDAITDPFMGYISDRTQSRWGRRRPYIVLGAILSGLAYMLIWWVPLNWSPNAQVGWFLATLLLFFTCMTIWNVPYISLGYELTPDYDERTSVMGVVSFAGQIASMIAPWVFPLAQLALFASLVQGIHVVTAAVGIVLIGIAGMIPGLFSRERYARSAPRPATSTTSRARLWRTFGSVLGNRNMILLLGMQLAGAVSSIFASGIDYYVIVYYMCEGDVARGSVLKGALSTTYAVAGLLSVPLIVQASKRFDKRNTLIGIYALNAIGAGLAWFTFTPAFPWLILVNPFLCTFVYTSTLLKNSMVADICDADELKSGERREGSYSALFAWMHKMSMSFSFLAAGVILNVAGFDAKLGGGQSPQTLTTLRLVLTGVPALSSLIPIVLLLFYSIDRNRASDTRTALEARRGAL